MPEIRELLDGGSGQLRVAGVESPRTACEWLLADILRCGRLELCLRYKEEMPAELLAQFRRGLQRLARHEPLQYVLCKEQFYGRAFKTDPRALIPRPETELLVETALNLPDVWAGVEPVVADAGTGSGVLAVTIALERPQAKVYAADNSRAALELAAENAVALGASGNITFLESDLLGALPAAETFDLVVSNPPYIKTGDIPALAPEICRHEPVEALDGGPDGLQVIRRLIPQAAQKLRVGGRLALEFGADQAAAVAKAMAAAGLADIRVLNDFNDLPRVAVAVKPSKESRSQIVQGGL